MRERTLIDRLLKPLAGHPAARGLTDDAAVLTPPDPRASLSAKFSRMSAKLRALPCRS